MTLSKRAAIVLAILPGIVAALVGSGVAMAQDGCTITVHADGITLGGCTVLTPTPAPTETPTPAPTATATAARYPLGADWAGATGGYYSDGERLIGDGGGAILWAERFGANQEAYVTLAGIPQRASGVALILLAQSAGGAGPALAVRYNPLSGTLSPWAADASGRWVSAGPAVAAAFAEGDQLGARYQGGILTGYRNGAEVLRLAVPAPSGEAGGYAGLNASAMRGWVFDDFGAGTLP